MDLRKKCFPVKLTSKFYKSKTKKKKQKQKQKQKQKKVKQNKQTNKNPVLPTEDYIQK